MSLEETQSFFTTYRDAFDRLDGDAVANLWHSSSGIADNHGPEQTAQLTWWPTDEPMRSNHKALCEVYRTADYGRADFVIEDHVSLGSNHAFAKLHWRLQRKDGTALQQFRTGYQLMRTAKGPQVVLAVAYQEDLKRLPSAAA
jgi:hypothetical protein